MQRKIRGFINGFVSHHIGWDQPYFKNKQEFDKLFKGEIFDWVEENSSYEQYVNKNYDKLQNIAYKAYLKGDNKERERARRLSRKKHLKIFKIDAKDRKALKLAPKYERASYYGGEAVEEEILDVLTKISKAILNNKKSNFSLKDKALAVAVAWQTFHSDYGFGDTFIGKAYRFFEKNQKLVKARYNYWDSVGSKIPGPTVWDDLQ